MSVACHQSHISKHDLQPDVAQMFRFSVSENNAKVRKKTAFPVEEFFFCFVPIMQGHTRQFSNGDEYAAEKFTFTQTLLDYNFMPFGMLPDTLLSWPIMRIEDFFFPLQLILTESSKKW